MGLGSHIAWFYAAVGFVSLFMPAAVGHVADRWVNPVRLLGICHLGGAGVMAALWLYACLLYTSLGRGAKLTLPLPRRMS